MRNEVENTKRYVTDFRTNSGAIQIMKVLPHRYPMLLIDTVEECVPGEFAVAKKNFSYDAAYIQGHYPENPIVPGTVLLESLTQTASYTVLSAEHKLNGGVILLFTGVSKLRFFRSVFPGDTVLFKSEVIRNAHGLWNIHGEGHRGDEMCICAEMTFMQKKEVEEVK